MRYTFFLLLVTIFIVGCSSDAPKTNTEVQIPATIERTITKIKTVKKKKDEVVTWKKFAKLVRKKSVTKREILFFNKWMPQALKVVHEYYVNNPKAKGKMDIDAIFQGDTTSEKMKRFYTEIWKVSRPVKTSEKAFKIKIERWQKLNAALLKNNILADILVSSIHLANPSVTILSIIICN